ncbi:LysR family transcriptional regulator [Nannocystis pusilla]|uniref:LysR family transcriptional regulator n=1 Tax=Nannocystis pusilla TaxID=889268 RepID=A0ABS7TXT4_9BACT|nr:LysR family transcriptional regulator [Nannocystis pusilla]MBZ5712952.1 LysR family transcriptional regulator [Nannocystis pusilla]
MARTVAPTSALLEDWDAVRYFLAVAREGSFSRAARALATDQSTVSRRVAALEEALGRKLFERGPRAVVQSTFGAQLVEQALEVERAMLALQDRAQACEGRVSGRVRVALTEGLAQHVVAPRVLPALLERHPELAIELLTSDAAVDLARHEADIALRFFRTPRGELVGQRVARIERVLLVSRAAKRRLRGVAARDLPWVTYVHPSFVAPERAWLDTIEAPRAILECTSVETQLALVRAGLGVAVAPRNFVEVMPELCVFDEVELPPLPPLEVYVVTRAAIRRVPRVAAVYEALVAGLRALEER